MITLPQPPGPGDRTSATFIRALLDYIRAVTPIQGPGIRLARTPNGTVFTADPGSRGRSSFAPWTFSCVESGSERTGGWYNCRLQVGYDPGWASPELHPGTDHVISGCDHTEDGVHYLEVQLGDPDAVEIKVAEAGVAPGSDYVRGIIRIKLAVISDGKATSYQLPHINPVIYKYV